MGLAEIRFRSQSYPQQPLFPIIFSYTLSEVNKEKIIGILLTIQVLIFSVIIKVYCVFGNVCWNTQVWYFSQLFVFELGTSYRFRLKHSLTLHRTQTTSNSFKHYTQQHDNGRKICSMNYGLFARNVFWRLWNG